MLTARYLGPSDFGVINYAASVVAFFVPIMQLGLNSTLVREIIAKPEREGEIMGTAVTMSFASALLSILGIFAFTSIANRGETETIVVSVLYGSLLLFQCFELLQYWFQAKLLSKYHAISALFAFALTSAYKIYLLVLGKSVYWFAVAQSLDFLIIAVALLAIYIKRSDQRMSFSFMTAKELFASSKYYIVSSLMITLFLQTDKVMLKIMIDDAACGIYSAAATCAGMTSFVFSAIIDSLRPIIFENKGKSEEGYKKTVTALYTIIIYLSLLQSLVISLFSGVIIKLFYGAEYLDAAPTLAVLVWYTTFSYLGAVRNIWILAENKQRYLWMINASGAALNIVINLILIPHIGILGAATASLITQLFTNVSIGFIMKPIRANNHLMIKSLNPKSLLDVIKTIK
jgi:O-antigen/teichoic acid export membrane protein